MEGSSSTQFSSLFFSCDPAVSEEKPHYFLDSCFLCKTPLHVGDELFMYKGDAPFCSEECRQQQIEIDDAKGRRKMKMSKKLKSKVGDDSNNSTAKPNEVYLRQADTAVAV
ncbi:uncharacterized protein A4U43_C04F12830 [Asparagus officinalis]|uniref:FLZ-type domain-containing protein n=1 Tax=Asparagus officinalis TaxID=4686 RepID=A0A5P1F5S5_ASPOF|nr:uncharacterized protein LOC109835891 [Asparagus officinalis]ONK71830.1 uncharacterized protein A4U43_C04F12830 [Asparagus officinalis]